MPTIRTKISKNRREDPFREIADAAVAAAEEVSCSFPEFAAGLRTILEAVSDRSELADDEEKSARGPGD